MEAQIHTLAQEVQRMAHEYNKRNQNVALLEDVLNWEGGEVERLCDKL